MAFPFWDKFDISEEQFAKMLKNSVKAPVKRKLEETVEEKTANEPNRKMSKVAEVIQYYGLKEYFETLMKVPYELKVKAKEYLETCYDTFITDEETERPPKEIMMDWALRQVNENKEEIDRLREEDERLKEEADRLREEDERLKEEDDRLREKERSKKEAKRLKKEADRLRAEDERLKEEAGRLKEEADRLREEDERLKEEADRLKEEADRLREEIEKAKEEAKRLKQAQENAKDQVVPQMPKDE